MYVRFHPQFKTPILNLTKLHTMREDKDNKYHVGKTITLAIAKDSKHNALRITKIVSIQQVEIIHVSEQIILVIVDGRKLGEIVKHSTLNCYETNVELRDFIYNDGFYKVGDFVKWFHTNYVGKIIHWTTKKY